MEQFRKFQKPFVWLLIICFLMYLLPSVYMGMQ
jgi:hypothetical protein